MFASTLTALSIFTGCASESAWVRDRHGRPHQTWERMGPTTYHRTSACADVSAHYVDPDSAGTQAQEACRIYLPGYSAKRSAEEQSRAYARLHDRR